MNYQEEMKLINECDFIKDKLQLFSIYLNISTVACEILANSLYSEYEVYFKEMLKAYLKVYIESLHENVTLEDFIHGLLRGVKVNSLSKLPEISSLLSFYEENLEDIRKQTPYVDEIDSLKIGIDAKERFTISVREFLSMTFNNFRNILISYPQVSELKLVLIDKLSKNIKTIREKSKSYNDFENNLAVESASIIFDEIDYENIDLIGALKPELKENFSQLDYENMKILEAIIVTSLVNKTHNYVQNPLNSLLHNMIRSRVSMSNTEFLQRLQYVRRMTNNLSKK